MGIASAQQKEAVIALNADGDITIAPDGHVTDFHLSTKLSPAVGKLVDGTVRSWHFEPVTVDGRAVNAKTTMSLRLSGTPAPNDSYSLRIESVHFGVLTRTKLKPPEYPGNAARVGLGARVVLYLVIDEDGKVIEALPGQTSLGMRAKNERDAEDWRQQFEKASIKAAKTWRYDPSELVDGKRVANRHAIAPIEFQPSRWHHGWTAYEPGPVHPAPWDKNDGDKNAQRFAQLADGETASTDSNFRLKDDVIGKTL
ncbi:MAG TPA: hypothetical protein VHE32_10795 [Rhodanobacteraceae bacterium]|nr:hypothetical protein [Rhodanobacteraceae bacterium]